MDKIKILIVDDHQMFIDGIKALFRNEKRIEFTDEALGGHEALEYLQHNHYDLVISDISMPEMNGVELVARIKEEHPETKVLILTMHNDHEFINHIIEVEAEGYVLKSANKFELKEAIMKIVDNGTYFSSEVVNLMMDNMTIKEEDTNIIQGLTPRELEILQLILQEKSTKEIAEILFISPRTVDTHRKHIMKKTGSQTLVGLIKCAIAEGLS